MIDFYFAESFMKVCGSSVKVWISFAQFEASEDGGGIVTARAVFTEGWVSLLLLLLLSDFLC